MNMLILGKPCDYGPLWHAHVESRAMEISPWARASSYQRIGIALAKAESLG